MPDTQNKNCTAERLPFVNKRICRTNYRCSETRSIYRWRLTSQYFYALKSICLINSRIYWKMYEYNNYKKLNFLINVRYKKNCIFFTVLEIFINVSKIVIHFEKKYNMFKVKSAWVCTDPTYSLVLYAYTSIWGVRPNKF